MLINRRHLAGLAVAALFTAPAWAADEHGTKDEAVTMANAAAAHVKAVGADRAYADFTNDKAQWSKKDLYVFALDANGGTRAHGANAKLVGKSLIALKDQNGKEFIKEMVAVGATQGEGWVDYDWVNPVSKKVEGKTTYVKRLAGTSDLVAVGIYR
jgi:signal transduction histidine kinase